MNLKTDSRLTDATHPIILGRQILDTLKIGSNGSQLFHLTESGTWQPNGAEVVRRWLAAEMGMAWTPATADVVVAWLIDSAPTDPKAIEDGTEAGGR